MIKKIFILFLTLSFYIVSADDSFDNFIDEQIGVEAKFLDLNLSLDDKLAIKKNQEMQYRKFFLLYASEKGKNLKSSNSYHSKTARLKLRLNENKYRKNTNAVKRDEVLLKDYEVRNMLKNILHDILLQTSGHSKAFYKEKVEQILLTYLSKYKPLDKQQYLGLDNNQTNPIVTSLHEAVKKQVYLDNVVSTFSSMLVEQSSNIKKTAQLSESKFFRTLNTINTSPFALKMNSYLSFIHLDIAKVILVILVIILLLAVQVFLRFVINRILQHFKLEEEDLEYIHTHITKLFNLIISVMIIHIILVSFMGIESRVLHISKLFAIFYVIAIALIIYRGTNTIAHIKREQMRKSKIIKNEVINLTLKAINGLIIIIAIIAILQVFGVNLTALLSGLGIAGAAVAFAAKDSISNIFGSISILIGDVFEQGDWIETSSVNGTVVEIGLRASTIRTFDNALISIPNSELANKGVKNWSRRSIGRRIKMHLGVTYQSDFKDIEQAILDIREMLKEHPGIANQRTEYNNSSRQSKLVSMEDYKGIKRTTLVYMDTFDESCITILVYCFSRTVVWEEWLEVKEDVMFKLADILKNNNLEFAYPSMALYHPEESLNDTEKIK